MKNYSYILLALAIGIGAVTANAQSLEMQAPNSVIHTKE
jgi:hypothetical protein